MRDNEAMTHAPVTEREAARLWALAYNTHDPTVLATILAEDVRVMSRWVVNDLVGRSPYLEYLERKFQTFDEARSVVRAEVAETPGRAGSSGRPCVVLEQDGALLATVLFDVVGGRLSQITMSAHPSPASCARTGEYPGFGDEDVVN
jgi:hypothetical protein